MHNKGYFYVSSLSSQTIIYKGLILANQIGNFYEDLKSPKFESTFAFIHQRYSTNTFPTWDLAQQFIYIVHNGEIIKYCGRLEPGKMFLLDLKEHRILKDEEIRQKIFKEYNYKS